MRLSKTILKCFLPVLMIFSSALADSVASMPITSQDKAREALMNEAKKLIREDHFFPFEMLSKLLDRYDHEDIARIHHDFLDLKEKTFKNAIRSPIYLATAGGPSAGKSSVLESVIADKGFAYIDPDRSCLFFMESTYKKDVANGYRSAQDAYYHWRDASNFLANAYLGFAFNEGYAIAHGSTLTAPNSVLVKIFSNIKNTYGYEIEILHINAPDSVRFASENYRRNKGIFQCTDEDLINKGQAFFDRIETYLGYSDKTIFYYRDKPELSCQAVAKIENSELDVFNRDCYRAIKDLHNKAKNDGQYWDLSLESVLNKK